MHKSYSPADLTPPFHMHLSCRLHSQHRVVDLLELGRVGFPLQLQAYLADYPHLLWMSQVQAQQYSAATGTLGKAAAAAPVQDAQRLWALTKLSGKASGARDGSGKQSMVMATARLRQLALQAALLPGRQQPMLAEELASAALRAAGQVVPAGGSDQGTVGLRGADAAVAAVEVLALEAGKSNTQSYRWGRNPSCSCCCPWAHASGSTGRLCYMCPRKAPSTSTALA